MSAIVGKEEIVAAIDGDAAAGKDVHAGINGQNTIATIFFAAGNRAHDLCLRINFANAEIIRIDDKEIAGFIDCDITGMTELRIRSQPAIATETAIAIAAARYRGDDTGDGINPANAVVIE